MRSIITGVGMCVPEQVITNNKMTDWMETSDEWILERTGIKERRFFEEGKDTVSNMGTRAAQQALERAGKKAEDLDLIVFATLSPDYYFPGPGVMVQHQLGCQHVCGLDIRAQCSGFVYGISIADQYIKSGMYKSVLVIGAEIQSNIFEMSTRGRNMAVIFGDGAGAAILEAHDGDDGRGILSTHMHSDGSFAEDLMLKHPSSQLKERFWPTMKEDGDLLPYMNGRLVFTHAVRRFPEVIREALDYSNLKVDDIDVLVPHQANVRITNAIIKELEIEREKVVSNIERFGNTTAASVPIALNEAWETGMIKEGSLVCLAAFGSGFTWGSAMIRW